MGTYCVRVDREYRGDPKKTYTYWWKSAGTYSTSPKDAARMPKKVAEAIAAEVGGAVVADSTA